jgi:hypothetical protein
MGHAVALRSYTGIDHMIPNFTSVTEALAQTGRRDHQPGLARELITPEARYGNLRSRRASTTSTTINVRPSSR